MMMNEFVERTGFEPTMEEYREIEEAYYNFDGDKNAFCKHWMETVGEKGMLMERAIHIENLRWPPTGCGRRHRPLSSAWRCARLQPYLRCFRPGRSGIRCHWCC